MGWLWGGEAPEIPIIMARYWGSEGRLESRVCGGRRRWKKHTLDNYWLGSAADLHCQALFACWTDLYFPDHQDIRIWVELWGVRFFLFRTNLNGHRYMAAGRWPRNKQQKAPRSFLHFQGSFHLFSTVFALLRSFSRFWGYLFLTLFGSLVPKIIGVPKSEFFKCAFAPLSSHPFCLSFFAPL